MIVLDTHIWVWWVHDAPELLPAYRAAVERHEAVGLGVSAITCWEVAMPNSTAIGVLLPVRSLACPQYNRMPSLVHRLT